MRFCRTVAGHSVIVCVALARQRVIQLRLAARWQGLHLVEPALLGGQPTRQHDGRRIVRRAPLLGRAGLVVPVVRIIAERKIRTLPAAAELHVAVGLDLGGDRAHVEHVDALGRLVRRHGGRHGVVVGELLVDGLEAGDDDGSGVVGACVVVLQVAIVAQREGLALPAPAELDLALLVGARRQLLEGDDVHAAERLVRRHVARDIVVLQRAPQLREGKGFRAKGVARTFARPVPAPSISPSGVTESVASFSPSL